MENNKKRYYRVGELVWVKRINNLGVIKELNVQPEKKIYEAIIEIVRGKEKGSSQKVNLWEINKVKKKQENNQVNKVAKKPTILISKVKKDAIIPSKIEENAGYDIYACFEEDAVIFKPHETKLIPTGVATSTTKEYALIAKERGSTGSQGMGIRAGVVDSSYRGEIFIALTNENDIPLVIAKKPELYYSENNIVYPYKKAIAQLVMVPVIDARVKEISYEDLKKIKSIRGDGALGSSNK